MEGLQHLRLWQIVQFVPGVSMNIIASGAQMMNIASGTQMCQSFLHFFYTRVSYAYQLNAVEMK